MSIYGIDLGTTNSLIGLHKTGYLSDIVPSCVDMKTGAAGAAYYDDMSATRSFKVDMSLGLEGTTPRAASKCVLEELKRQVKDDTVKDVVISVPAYFSDNQRQATIESAKLAGLDVKALVNEPTAAAMFIANNRKGLYCVYDLGGGTFDCSIIDSRFGAFDVQATDGRVIGGDNFDANIMKHIIREGHVPIHTLTEEATLELQHYATKAKIALQKSRNDVELDLSRWNADKFILTVANYINIMKITFSDTLNCMQSLISKWIPSTEKYEILLVGGSTHCPYLQEWVYNVTGVHPNGLTYDPDRVVAQGAALYADLLEKGELLVSVSDVTKQLGIGLFDGTIDVLVPSNSKTPLSVEKMLVNQNDTDTLEVSLYQGQSAFVSGAEKIGTLIYPYGEMKPARTGQVLAKIVIDHSGIIELSVRELLKDPVTITLRRGD